MLKRILQPIQKELQHLSLRRECLGTCTTSGLFILLHYCEKKRARRGYLISLTLTNFNDENKVERNW